MTTYRIFFFLLFLWACFPLPIKAQKPAFDMNVFRALTSTEERLDFIDLRNQNKLDTTDFKLFFKQLYPLIVEKNDLPCL